MSDKRFKPRSVKIYCSNEWMADSTKKYRTAFDKNEISYLWAEFSVFNKLFDEKDWEDDFNLKAFDLNDGKKELCDQEEKIKVSKEENVVYFRKGWGTEAAGGFWEEGKYSWEAYIGNTLIDSAIFQVNDVGLVSENNNPYFSVDSVKLFNGLYDGWKIEKKDRLYLKKFDRDQTQYIWVELIVKSKINKAYNAEFFFNFFDDAGQPKAKMSVSDLVESGNKDKLYTFNRGWGSDSTGTWKDNKYMLEIVFNDTLIAAVSFEVGDANEEGVPDLMLNRENIIKSVSQSSAPIEQTEKSLAELMAELEGLIGLQDIKKKIKDHLRYIEFIKLRNEKGFDEQESISLHSVFTGNPGSGKTTVVKMLGQIYKQMGLLSKGHVIEADRADLVGEFIGQTAPRTKKLIEQARGGILFIDEAYSLARAKDDPKDFGKEVIETVIKEMSDGAGDIAIMVAGYPKEMDNFLDSNPGLRSRFNYYFVFDDYLPDELMEIAKYAAKKRSVEFNKEALIAVESIVQEAYRNRDSSFGNARFVYSIVDEAKMNMGLRLMEKDIKKISKKDLMNITLEDIENLKKVAKVRNPNIKMDERLLADSLQELNSYVGLQNVKTEINDIVKLVRYYRETGKDVLNRFALHTVFVGNPGTGKTTIARLIGKIYKALGILERGHVVEADRESLVAGFTGQTAIKTKEKIDAAMNGVLFVDEAYALDDNSFGRESIEVILKNMEDHRGKLALIVAGYPENMSKFLNSNPGLRSRFDRTFNFADYTPLELLHILDFMLKRYDLFLDEGAKLYLEVYIEEIYKDRDKYFGNAREIRKMVEDIVKKQNLRLASMPSDERTLKLIETVTIADVAHFEYKAAESKLGKIGFGSK